MPEIYAVLLSWAVTLSGYPAPRELPIIVRQPHAFFVERACHGRDCKVLGWYAGGREVHLDESLDAEYDLLASSIVVHEMVHYLQAVARGDDTLEGGVAYHAAPSCQQLIRWEREAYAVQRQFILQYGRYLPVGASMRHAHC